MNRHTLSLGKIYGIPIRLHWTWFLVFALITFGLATTYFPFELRRQPAGLYWILGAITAVLLFVSVLLHELGHSVVAIHHNVPVRRITLFIFGGVAEIGAEPPTAQSEFLIAIAGPLVSLALAALFAALQLVAGFWAPLFLVARYLTLINGTLALFNMVPGFPLDGGRVLRSIIWGITRDLRRATWLAASLGRAIGFVFIAWGVWRAFRGDLGGMWYMFIGWYLQKAAASQLQQQAITSVLTSHPVSEAMNHSYVLIPGDTSLRQVVERNLPAKGQRAFVVTNDETVTGELSWSDVEAVPRALWETTTAAQAATPVASLRALDPTTSLQAAIEEITRPDVASLPVISNGRVLGTISSEEVHWFLRRLNALRT